MERRCFKAKLGLWKIFFMDSVFLCVCMFFIHLNRKFKLLTHLPSRQMQGAGTFVGVLKYTIYYTYVHAEKKPTNIMEIKQSLWGFSFCVYISIKLLAQFYYQFQGVFVSHVQNDSSEIRLEGMKWFLPRVSKELSS